MKNQPIANLDTLEMHKSPAYRKYIRNQVGKRTEERSTEKGKGTRVEQLHIKLSSLRGKILDVDLHLQNKRNAG